jgi:OMF family outer membrane factor
MRSGFIIFLLLSTFFSRAQTVSLPSLESAFRFADTSSFVMDQANIQEKLAKLTTNASYGNVLNPRIPVTGALTNNTNLQVSFIPAEIFGGPAGTFREVTMGQQYITSLTIAPQFDIINPGHLSDMKSARLNEEVVQWENKQSKQDLYDQINSAYHNILSFQAQIGVLQRHVEIADSILKIVEGKNALGMVRAQDLNDATINLIQYQNKLDQAKTAVENQYFMLAILLDTEKSLEVSADLWAYSPTMESSLATGDLSVKSYLAREAYAKQTWRSAQWNQLPTLSFVSSLSWQNNSNAKFMDPAQRWINANYLGLRLSWDFPTNVQKLTTSSNAKLNFQLAEEAADHARLQTTFQNQQMNNDYEKALSDYESALRVFVLEENSFGHLLNQYDADLVALDKLLAGQVKLMAARLNMASALATVAYSKEKINIHNSIR